MSAWWIVVFFAIFLIGVTKSGFGSGVGLMIVPMSMIAMKHIPGLGSEATLGLLLPLLIAGDLIAVWQYRKLFGAKPADGERGDCELRIANSELKAGAMPHSPSEIRDSKSAAALDDAPIGAAPSAAGSIVRALLPGTVAGVILGGLLLWWVDKQSHIVGALMRIEIGIESILLVGLHWWRQWRGMQERLMREPLRSNLTGGFAAVSSTLAHAAGPIIAMYLLPLRLDRRLYVGVCALYFFLLNTAKLPAYAASGQFARADVLFTLRFLPLVVAGALFGFWVNKRMSDKVFTSLVYAITFALGIYILIDGGVSLGKAWGA